jgi:hypothetical protein
MGNVKENKIKITIGMRVRVMTQKEPNLDNLCNNFYIDSTTLKIESILKKETMLNTKIGKEREALGEGRLGKNLKIGIPLI